MAEPSDDDTLDAVAEELYALSPEEFTASRNARAAAESGALATRIKTLKKPTVAAWAVNLLVRDGQLVDAVELSHALREAQDDLDAAELARLGRQRRALVAGLARSASDLASAAGTSLSKPVLEDVEKTINAAVMDAAAGAAVLTGRLIRPLEATGLEGVEVSEVVGGSVPGVAPAPPARTRDDLAARRARKAAEAAARDADRAASEAERELARVDARLGKARERADLLRDRLDELRRELGRITEESDAAAADVQRLDGERTEAASRARAAAKDAERARAALPEPQSS